MALYAKFHVPYIYIYISSNLQDSAGVSKAHQAQTLSTNSEGEKYVDLGKKKRATVRSFKSIPLLDIREFYGTDGQEKPGKKGISLTLDQARRSYHSFIYKFTSSIFSVGGSETKRKHNRPTFLNPKEKMKDGAT